MITLFDKQEIEDRYLRNTIREAVAKAVTENSEKQDVEYAQKLIRFGALSLEDIANLTTLPLERVRSIAAAINS